MKRNIWLYYATDFFSNLWFVIPIWVAYQRQFLTFSQMSLFASIRIALALILELPTGAFADLFGRKTSIITGSIIVALGSVIMGIARNKYDYLIGTTAMGIGDAFLSGAALAFVFDILKKHNAIGEFAKIRSKGVFFAQVGIIISSIAAGYMYEAWKGLPYIACAGSILAMALCFYFMDKEEPRKKEAINLSSYLHKTYLGLGELVKTHHIKMLSLFYILVAGISWSWQVYFNQIYASAIGYNEIQKGWLFGIIRVVNAIFIMKLFTKAIFTKRVIYLFFPFLMLATALSAPIRIFAFDTMLLFFMTLASSLRFSVLDGYINEEFDSQHRATALSSMNMFVRLIYVLSVALSGPALDRYFPGYIYFVMGGISLVTIVPLGVYLSQTCVRHRIVIEPVSQVAVPPATEL